MDSVRFRKIVILGGGTAGWMTAAALSRFLNNETEITLVESDAIGTVGVGEATIPHIRVFNEMLGIDEADFMKSTQATYKLGIRFEGWGSAESIYYHPFGEHGFPINGIDFHHYWLSIRNQNGTPPFDQFSLANVMAHAQRFAYPVADRQSVESTYSYAYHLDAASYAKFLRAYAEKLSVKRIEGQMTNLERSADTGDITELHLSDGRKVEGDFFIDCSGFRASLIGGSLGVPFQSWKSWLPCDSAVAIPSELAGDPVPYTRSIAKSAGWMWQIPLRHRLGNGYVYSSEFHSTSTAEKKLLESIPGKPLAEPRHLRFEAGMRESSWEKNCVAIGLASGFLEPLESTSIYLIQVGIYKLLELLPASNNVELEAKEYNRLVSNEYKKVRDFIILHYWLNRRPEDFWHTCANMKLPDSLQEKIEVFVGSAAVVEYESGLFMPPSWLAVYFGQGLYPERVDSRLAGIKATQVEGLLKQMHQHLQVVANKLPDHKFALAGQALSGAVRAAPRLSLYGAR